MINRDSFAYRSGKFAARVILIGVGYLMGKRWKQKPLKKSFPEKK